MSNMTKFLLSVLLLAAAQISMWEDRRLDMQEAALIVPGKPILLLAGR